MSILGRFSKIMVEDSDRKQKKEIDDFMKLIYRNINEFRRCCNQQNHVKSVTTEKTNYMYVLGHSSEYTLNTTCILPPNTIAIEGSCLTPQNVSRSWEIRNATNYFENSLGIDLFINACLNDRNQFAKNIGIKYSITTRISSLLLDFNKKNYTIVLNSGIRNNESMPLEPQFTVLNKSTSNDDYILTLDDVIIIYNGSLYPTVDQARDCWDSSNSLDNAKSFNHFKENLKRYTGVPISYIMCMLHKYNRLQNVCWVLTTCRVGNIGEDQISRGEQSSSYCLVNEDDPRCTTAKRNSDESKIMTNLTDYNCIWIFLDIWHGIQIDGDNNYISEVNPSKDSSAIIRINHLNIDNYRIILYKGNVYKYDYQNCNIIQRINDWNIKAGYQFTTVNRHYIIRKDERSPALYVKLSRSSNNLEVTDLNRTISIRSVGNASADYTNAVNEFGRSAAGIKSKKRRNKKRKSKKINKKS
jgi:hypothetical protein